MSTILNHATPAERERGLIWMETFSDAGSIVENGGTLVGTPTFNKGIVLDGTTDYVSFNNVVGKFNHASMSIFIKFVPDFAYDENAQRTLLDTTNGARYRIVKQNNASSNVLSIVLGGTTIADIPSATYDSSWNQGEENVLVITSTTGDTSAWLNGTQILTNDNTAWTPLNPTEMYAGAKYDASGLFDGEMTELKVFSKQLTDQEGLDLSNQTVYNYINQTTADIPMNMANHDPTNTRSLDVSGNGYHMTWGTGAVGTFPTKNTTTQGYDFDGGDFMVISSGLGITDYPVTMSIWFRTQGIGISCFIDLADSSSSTRNMSLILDVNEQLQATVRNPTFNSAGGLQADKGNWIHGVGVFHSTTSRELYVNGTLYASDTGSVTMYTPDRFTIGRFGDLTPSGTITADMAKAKVWNLALTPMQIVDLYYKDLNNFSEV